MTPRSWLFVPGDRPERMEKALASGADALILDLEDSVAPGAKADARSAVGDFLSRRRHGAPELWVRINPLADGPGEQDLDAVMNAAPTGLVLPKSTPAEVRRLGERLDALEGRSDTRRDGVRILPIATETAAAVFRLDGYAACADRLGALTWGAEDLSADIGATAARDERGGYTSVYELARALTLLAATAASVAAVETVYPDFGDLDGLTRYVARGRRDGFVGMMAIHPRQVAIINAGFSPTAAEVTHAQAIVAAFAAHPGAGVVSLRGKMLDAPHLTQARRVLDRVSPSEGDCT